MKIIRNCDRWSQTLNFHFKGSDQFKTNIGGIFSLVTYAIILGYATMKIISLVNRSDNELKTTQKSIDLTKTEHINLKDMGFDLSAVTLQLDNFKLVEIPAEIGTF